MKATYLLLEDIVAEIEKDFANLKFDGDKDISTAPNVWIGHVPPKISMPTSAESKPTSGDPPFILVRYLDDEITDTRDKGQVLEAKVGILCCTYSKDSYEDIKLGYKDIMNMLDRVYLTLMKKRFWVGKVWWRDGSIKRTVGLQKELSSIYEAGVQDHPYYGAALVTTFKEAAIVEPSIK
jgi:hypothetical protein